MNSIDSKAFFNDLAGKPFCLVLGDEDKLRLEQVLAYWKKQFDADEDLRKLAFVLARVHREKPRLSNNGDKLSPANEQLRSYFAIPKPSWAVVKYTTGEVTDPIPDSFLQDMFYSTLSKMNPISLAQVLAEELKCSKGLDVSRDNLESVFKNLHAANLKAICFSGGGIRSATFGLGIVQALAQHNLLDKFDYLSTVSGGGYLGSWLSAWIRRERLKKAARFKAVSSKEKTAEIEREGDARVKALSALQLEALRVLAKLRTDNPKVSEATLNEVRDKLIETGLSSKEVNVLTSLELREIEELLADPDFRNAGVRAVRDQINCIEIESDTQPTPEPLQLRHLREYSNYMSPKTGLLSADTWTLPAIYLRNLLLNLTIFVPLLAAVLLLPRFLFLIVDYRDKTNVLTLRMVVAAIAMGCLAFAFVISRLPSKQPHKVEEGDPKTKGFRKKATAFLNSETGVLVFGVLPLIASAFLAITAWAWNYRTRGMLFRSNIIAEPEEYAGLEFFITAAAVAFVVAVSIFLLINWGRGVSLWEALAALVSSILGGAFLWLCVQKVFVPYTWSAALGPRFAAYEWQVYLCLAVPAFLLVVLIAATIYVGLSSLKSSDEDREWLARYGGWVLIVSVAWIILNALTLLGPSVLQWMFRPLYNASEITWGTIFSSYTGVSAVASTIIGVISGIVSLGGGFSGQSLVRNEPVKSKTSKFLAIAPQIAAVVFLGFILVGLAFASTWLIYQTSQNTSNGLYHAYVLRDSSTAVLLPMLLILGAVGIGMGFVVNVNKFSLHGAYRDRLTRAYLGASNPKRNQNTFTGFDDSDNLELHDLEGQRPFHVINATVNLVGGKNLAWQNRKAASFTMTPLHCGSWAVRGYRRSIEYCVSKTSGKALRLGTAMAISGAAANPNMGYISSPVVTFLMALFNIRLGWWLGNTGPAGSDRDWFGLRGNYRFFQKVGPSVAVFPLINETLGRTDENKHFLNVSDGGHFENLALYEMVLRRCRFILLSDGAADDSFKFGEISNAIQKCKVDLGVDIKFRNGIKIVSRDTDADGKKGAVRFAIADVTYPEMVGGNHLTGTLLYMRPTYYENEYTDIKHYAEANETFPHQSTGDQMYDEKQFEAYRGLGFFTMQEIYNTFVATAKGDPDNEVDDDLEEQFATEEDLRTTVFEFFDLQNSGSYKPRGKRGTAD